MSIFIRVGPKICKHSMSSLGPVEPLWLEFGTYWTKIIMWGFNPDQYGNRRRDVLIRHRTLGLAYVRVRNFILNLYYKVTGEHCHECGSKECRSPGDVLYQLDGMLYCSECFAYHDWLCACCQEPYRDTAYDDSDAPCTECAQGEADYYYDLAMDK